MAAHDIIDSRSEKLVDHIGRILSSSGGARFAVGHFFVSGLTSIADRLTAVKELRLLVGNATSRETLEQLAEGYGRLEIVANAVEEQAFPKRTEARCMADKPMTVTEMARMGELQGPTPTPRPNFGSGAGGEDGPRSSTRRTSPG
jgi:hypothetical protein